LKGDDALWSAQSIPPWYTLVCAPEGVPSKTQVAPWSVDL
jgi:hypothetical protein